MINIKKVFIIFILSLVIILSSVVMVFATSYTNTFFIMPSNSYFYLTNNNPLNFAVIQHTGISEFCFYDSQGNFIDRWYVSSATSINGLRFDNSILYRVIGDVRPYPTMAGNIFLSNLSGPIRVQNYYTESVTPFNQYTDVILGIEGLQTLPTMPTTISLTPSQRILFNYTDSNKSTFLKSLSCTRGKGITLTQGYYSNGQVNDLSIKKDTTDIPFQINPQAITLASFPSPRTLLSNELLGFSQANGGNLPINGNPISTDTTALVTITFDSTKCSYSIISANTGLVITSGGITGGVSTGGVYNNSDDPVIGQISDDYMLDRADYSNDLMGSVMYGFDTIFKFLKMPFEILAKFILTLGEIVSYAVGSIGGLMGALTGLYGVFPSALSYLFVFAISISVFKLIFGR